MYIDGFDVKKIDELHFFALLLRWADGYLLRDVLRRRLLPPRKA